MNNSGFISGPLSSSDWSFDTSLIDRQWHFIVPVIIYSLLNMLSNGFRKTKISEWLWWVALNGQQQQPYQSSVWDDKDKRYTWAQSENAMYWLLRVWWRSTGEQKWLAGMALTQWLVSIPFTYYYTGECRIHVEHINTQWGYGSAFACRNAISNQKLFITFTYNHTSFPLHINYYIIVYTISSPLIKTIRSVYVADDDDTFGQATTTRTNTTKFQVGLN